jgi:hypothetical protein
VTHKISSVYSVPQSSIKTELFTNGPVESAFTVYADFPGTSHRGDTAMTSARGSLLLPYSLPNLSRSLVLIFQPTSLGSTSTKPARSSVATRLRSLAMARRVASRTGLCRTRGPPRGATEGTSRSRRLARTVGSRSRRWRARRKEREREREKRREPSGCKKRGDIICNIGVVVVEAIPSRRTPSMLPSLRIPLRCIGHKM